MHTPEISLLPPAGDMDARGAVHYRLLAGLIVCAMLLGGLGASIWLWRQVEAARRLADQRTAQLAALRQSEAAARRIAEDSTARFDLLAYSVHLDEAIAAEAQLYPAWPANIQRMSQWLETRAQILVDALPDLIGRRDELRARALPLSAADRRRDRETHPDFATLRARELELSRLRARAAGGEENDDLADLAQSVADLRERVEARRTFRFADKGQKFLHDALERLIRDIRAFADEGTGTMARVKRRLAWAKVVRTWSVDDQTALWQRAAREIARTPGYRGLKLSPQVGLVPLGKDPGSGLQEFVHLRSGSDPFDTPARDADGRLRRTPDSGLIFVLIPGGTFHMGAQCDDRAAPNYDPQAHPDEDPPQRVTVAPFFLSKYEMTQMQWRNLSAGETPSYQQAGKSYRGSREITWAHPVEQVDWNACSEILRRHGLLLPTEAQWEYACRAMTSTSWHTGDQASSLQDFANISDQRAKLRFPAWDYESAVDDGWVGHAPVGSFRPNGFGLFDMHGNVWEWCRDEELDYATPAREGDGLRGSPVASLAYRMRRGGSFGQAAGFARSAFRSAVEPTTKDFDLGLRPCRRVID